MATTTAPDALYGVYKLIDPHFTTNKIGGVVGDANHGSGYHLSRDRLKQLGKTSDYSIQLAADRKGAGGYASAIDITFGAASEQIALSKRLRAAFTAKDPRLAVCREFIGTVDGRNVSGWNNYASGSGSRSKVGWHPSGYSDSSHLWHVHISVLRQWCDDANAMRGLAEVIAGQQAGTFGWVDPAPATPPNPPATPTIETVRLPDLLAAIKAGRKSALVAVLQQALIGHGYPVGRSGADGWWGGDTKAAVARVQVERLGAKAGTSGADGIPGQRTLDWLRTPVKVVTPAKPSKPTNVDPPVVTPEPTVPTFKVPGPYTLLAVLDAPGAGNWQGAVQNRTTGEWFICEGKKTASGEDAIYYRFTAEGVYADCMTVTGGGHQTSFSVSSTNVIWCAVGGKLCTIRYRPGQTVPKSVGTTMDDPVAGATNQISLTPTRTRAVIRRVMTSVEEYRLFQKDDNGRFGKQIGETVQVARDDNRVVQGFGASNTELRILTGHSNGPSFVERYSFDTGKHIANLDVTDWGIYPGEENLKFEVEGLDGTRIGCKVGQGDIRELRILDIDYSKV